MRVIRTWRVVLIKCKNRVLGDLDGESYDVTNAMAGCGILGLLMAATLPHGFYTYAWLYLSLVAAWISLGGYAGEMENGGKVAAWMEFSEQYLARG
jgi:hypothetical protein